MSLYFNTQKIAATNEFNLIVKANCYINVIDVLVQKLITPLISLDERRLIISIIYKYSILYRFVIFQAFTKLDQLEVQMSTTEHTQHSEGLARLHGQSVKTLDEVTEKPLAEGHAILESTGRGAPGAEVRFIVYQFQSTRVL